jgi:exonuclease III
MFNGQAVAVVCSETLDVTTHQCCVTSQNSEHHLTDTQIKNIYINSYRLGSYYARKTCKSGDVSIYVHESFQFSPIHLKKYCMDKETEAYVIKLDKFPTNICILAIYRSPSGKFSHFLQSLESILTLLQKKSSEIIICGDININYMVKNRTKQ